MRIVYITIEQSYSDLSQDDKRATEMFFFWMEYLPGLEEIQT